MLNRLSDILSLAIRIVMKENSTRSIERQIGNKVRANLPFGLAEFVMFGLKQAWACLFGGLLLAGIIVSKLIWQDDWALVRYDALVLYAVGLQVAFLYFKLETWREARVILLFHLTGTVMEFFKVSAGSWAYPEEAVLKILGVPLFSGFMYASVGSYIARVMRIFHMTFAPYPPFWATVVFATAIYINFFSHHFLPDIRILLFAASLLLFMKTRVWFIIGQRAWWMPMPVAGFLVAIFLWIAENIGTSTGTWLYAGQAMLDWVSLAKLGSWYLLLFVSFVTVTLVFRNELKADKITQEEALQRQNASDEKLRT